MQTITKSSVRKFPSKLGHTLHTQSQYSNNSQTQTQTQTITKFSVCNTPTPLSHTLYTHSKKSQTQTISQSSGHTLHTQSQYSNKTQTQTQTITKFSVCNTLAPLGHTLYTHSKKTQRQIISKSSGHTLHIQSQYSIKTQTQTQTITKSSVCNTPAPLGHTLHTQSQ